jgi:hypothetical protein
MSQRFDDCFIQLKAAKVPRVLNAHATVSTAATPWPN